MQFAYDVRFESLGAYLDAVEATGTHGGYAALGRVDSSTDLDQAFYGRPLAAMIHDCRTMQGFETEIEAIRALANTLQTTIPAVQSLKRQRTAGADSTANNPTYRTSWLANTFGYI